MSVYNAPYGTFQACKLDDKAIIPKAGSAYAAGYDLCASKHVVIAAGKHDAVRTGIAIALPAGTMGRILPRSGLAFNHRIAVNAGVIDQDYRGEVKVILENLSEKDFEIKVGDRIAQLVLIPILSPAQYPITEVSEVDALGKTGRGVGGFGSTGIGAL
jgi:dUTP pyrophosphatase